MSAIASRPLRTSSSLNHGSAAVVVWRMSCLIAAANFLDRSVDQLMKTRKATSPTWALTQRYLRCSASPSKCGRSGLSGQHSRRRCQGARRYRTQTRGGPSLEAHGWNSAPEAFRSQSASAERGRIQVDRRRPRPLSPDLPAERESRRPGPRSTEPEARTGRQTRPPTATCCRSLSIATSESIRIARAMSATSFESLRRTVDRIIWTGPR